MKNYIGIKNGDGVIERLIGMGDKVKKNCIHIYSSKWVFIVIKDTNNYGQLVDGLFISDDVDISIDDIPLCKDLKEWVKMYKEGFKMGLL